MNHMLALRMPLFILCNANPNVGYGHFFRCLYFARQWQVITATQIHWIGEIAPELHSTALATTSAELTNSIDIVSSPDASVIALKNATLTASNNIFDSYQAKDTKTEQNINHSIKPFCLCDSYLLTDDQLEELSSSCHLIMIEDFGRLTCKQAFAVINFTVAAHRYQYLSSHRLLGSRFFLCSPKLDQVRDTNLLSEYPRLQHSNMRFTIAIGGFDRYKIGLLIGRALVKSELNCEIILLGIYDESDIAKLNQISRQASIKFTHIVRTQHMEKVYRATDVLISGGGLTKYEGAYCGIPNVVVAQTREQLEESYEFEEKGLCRTYGLASELAKELHASFENGEKTAKTVADLTFIDWIKTFDWLNEASVLQATSRESFSNKTTENVVRQLLIHAEASVE